MCRYHFATLEISLNQDILVTWFSQNYLIANSIKTQGMLLGSHTHAYVPEFFIGDSKVELANFLKILGLTIDNKLTYCEHISHMLKKVYAKTAVLRRLRADAS